MPRQPGKPNWRKHNAARAAMRAERRQEKEEAWKRRLAIMEQEDAARKAAKAAARAAKAAAKSEARAVKAAASR